MVSSIAAAIAFAVGVGIVVFILIPRRSSSPFAAATLRSRGVGERIQQSLRQAGIFDQTPTFVLLGLLIATVVVAVVLVALLHSIFWAIPAPAIVFFTFQLTLIRRQRGFMTRATDELVPFLNRISTSVKAGRPVQAAYIDAVHEANELRALLEDSAAKISSGMRFSDALLETLQVLPLRMWAVFVRQLELYDKTGGDVSSALEVSVQQINSMLALQAEARADYAIQARQQNLIILIALFGVAAFIVVVNHNALHTLITYPGIIGLFLGLGVMAAGIWFGRKQIRDIERKLSF
jgi:Flp pilus assembly protein TadB